MIEVQERDPMEEAVPADVSAGALLRRAREAAGLHVAALAVSMKVPVRKLEALEDDRYDLLPDAVFARGLASSICRALKVDPKPVLDRLPQSTTPRLVKDTDGLNAPFRAPGEGAPPMWADRLRQPVFLAVSALLLGAAILLVLPAVRKDEKPAQPAAAAQAEAADEPAAVPQPAPMTVNEPVPAAMPGASSPAVVPPMAAASSVPAQASPRPPAAVPAPQSSASAVAPAAALPTAMVADADAAAAAAGVLVIRARGESWVEVTDAAKVVVMRKVLTAGESASASGALPLQVTVGRVHLTDVLVRGKPLDLRTMSSNDVARFEVK